LLSLPNTLEDITPAWLSEALAPEFRDVRVVTAEVTDVIAATATKARIRLSYEHDAGARPSLIAKGGLFGHEHEQALAPLYHNETVFYRDVAPKLGVEVPRCYVAIADERDGVVLIEDLALTDVSFGEGRRPLDAETVAQGLDYQARFHARYWGQDAVLGGLGLMDLRGFLSAFFGGLAPHFTIEDPGGPDDATLAAVREAQAAMADRRTFAEAVITNWGRNAEDPSCLIHFDTHVGNMFFAPGGGLGWLDWQLCGTGNWAWDVAYFIIGALTPADRRAHEHDLVEHYLGRLADAGVTPPTVSDGWEAYRRNAIWGLSWTLVPDVMQQWENGYPIIERFLLAIRDLESLTALGLPAGGAWTH
jgi:Phosphotransferase enzyme family